MSGPTKSELERRVLDVVVKFHQEQQGCIPAEAKATLLNDMMVVVTGGIFTPTEMVLSNSDEGKKLIQSARREQRALTRREIETEVAIIMDRPVVRSYYDLDVRVGEQIEVYMLLPLD